MVSNPSPGIQKTMIQQPCWCHGFQSIQNPIENPLKSVYAPNLNLLNRADMCVWKLKG